MRAQGAKPLTQDRAWLAAPPSFLAGVLLALLLVPACTAKDPGPSKHAMVAGHVDLAAVMALPGTDLRVRLKDPALGGRILGTSTIKGVGSGRIPFVIRYDPRQIAADRRYQVEAEVTGPSGSRLGAVVPVEVNPHDQQEVEVALAPTPVDPDAGRPAARRPSAIPRQGPR